MMKWAFLAFFFLFFAAFAQAETTKDFLQKLLEHKSDPLQLGQDLLELNQLHLRKHNPWLENAIANIIEDVLKNPSLADRTKSSIIFQATTFFAMNPPRTGKTQALLVELLNESKNDRLYSAFAYAGVIKNSELALAKSHDIHPMERSLLKKLMVIHEDKALTSEMVQSLAKSHEGRMALLEHLKLQPIEARGLKQADHMTGLASDYVVGLWNELAQTGIKDSIFLDAAKAYLEREKDPVVVRHALVGSPYLVERTGVQVPQNFFTPETVAELQWEYSKNKKTADSIAANAEMKNALRSLGRKTLLDSLNTHPLSTLKMIVDLYPDDAEILGKVLGKIQQGRFLPKQYGDTDEVTAKNFIGELLRKSQTKNPVHQKAFLEMIQTMPKEKPIRIKFLADLLTLDLQPNVHLELGKWLQEEPELEKLLRDQQGIIDITSEQIEKISLAKRKARVCDPKLYLRVVK